MLPPRWVLLEQQLQGQLISWQFPRCCLESCPWLCSKLSSHSHSWRSNRHTDLTHLKQKISFPLNLPLLCLWNFNSHSCLCEFTLAKNLRMSLDLSLIHSFYTNLKQQQQQQKQYLQNIYQGPCYFLVVTFQLRPCHFSPTVTVKAFSLALWSVLSPLLSVASMSRKLCFWHHIKGLALSDHPAPFSHLQLCSLHMCLLLA